MMTDRYNQTGVHSAADLAEQTLLNILLYTIGSFWLLAAATTLAAESAHSLPGIEPLFGVIDKP
jgi:hypothetical protein